MKSGSDSSSNCRLENSWGSVHHRELIKLRRLLYLITFLERGERSLIDSNRMHIYSNQNAGSSRKYNPCGRDSNRLRARFTDFVSCCGRSYAIALQHNRNTTDTGYRLPAVKTITFAVCDITDNCSTRHNTEKTPPAKSKKRINLKARKHDKQQDFKKHYVRTIKFFRFNN
jgi:hypothetical protein